MFSQKRRARMGKQLLSASLALVLFGVSACAGQSAAPSTSQTGEAAAPASTEASSLAIETEQAAVPNSDEPQTVYKVGIAQFMSHGSLDNCRKGFIQGLNEGGYEEGSNLEIDYQDAQGDMSLGKSIVQSFIAQGEQVVCAIATPIAQAAANELQNTGIPLVFNAVSEPIEAGLIDGFDQVTEGITGVSDKLPVEQQLALIREILPDAKTIGILYTTNEANSLAHIRQFEEAAPRYGFSIVTMGVSTSSEIGTALDAILQKVDCLQNLTDNMVVNALDQVLSKSDAAKIPVFGSEEEQVIKGCLASEGVDYVGLGRQAGLQAAKLLDGIPLAEIPVEVYNQSKLTINKEVAQKLGIEITQATLDRAELTPNS